MNAHISIHIQPRRWPSEDDYQFAISFDEELIRDTLVSIERCSPDNDFELKILNELSCPSKVRTKVIKNREKLSKRIAKEISTKFLDYLERKDTVNGYTKKEDEYFYGK